MFTVSQFKAVCRLMRSFGFPKDTPMEVAEKLIETIHAAKKEYEENISHGKKESQVEQSEAAGL